MTLRWAAAGIALAVGAVVAWRLWRAPGTPSVSQGPAACRFVDVAPSLGMDRVLRSGGQEKLWILENVGTGCAFLDANGDGLLDVFVANAGVVKDGKIEAGPGPALYVQGPDHRFSDRTVDAGLASKAWQTGVAVGDIDNDGDDDLFVACYGRPLLYRNRGEGAFEEVSGSMGLTGSRFATSAVFLDFDGDGLLDLYSAGYVRFDPAHLPNGGRPCIVGGAQVACGPGHCEPEPHKLFRNVDGRRFEDVSESTGIARAEGAYGLGVASADVDGDGRQDIFVANDTTANFLWRNTGGRFEDVALWSGCALSDSGQGQAGMGVDIADADGDLRLDLFVTNYSEELNAYYRALPDGTFEYATRTSGLAAECFPLLGWGAKFADFDNDGDLDLIVANGHVHPQAQQENPAFTYPQRCLFYRNEGGGRFAEEGRRMGEDLGKLRAHRGLAIGDVDNDGDIDVLLTALDGPLVLLRNDTVGLGNWISFRLRGTRSNRDGIGATVIVRAAGKDQIRVVTRGGSYLSASDPRVHFGLGSAAQVERVTVRWPSGATTQHGPFRANSFQVLGEGS